MRFTGEWVGVGFKERKIYEGTRGGRGREEVVALRMHYGKQGWGEGPAVDSCTCVLRRVGFIPLSLRSGGRFGHDQILAAALLLSYCKGSLPSHLGCLSCLKEQVSLLSVHTARGHLLHGNF